MLGMAYTQLIKSKAWFRNLSNKIEFSIKECQKELHKIRLGFQLHPSPKSLATRVCNEK